MKEIQLKFDDGSKLTITATGGQAETSYLLRLQGAVERLRMYIAQRQGCCCGELKANLGNNDRYPTLAYISQENWDNRLDWVYPGATGPGYYEIYDLVGSEEIVYKRLGFCPFCHTAISEIGAKGHD